MKQEGSALGSLTNQNHLDVLFEDNHLLVVNKPAGIPTQKVEGQVSLEDRVHRYLEEKTGKPKVFVHPIHRLDKVTSGVCVFAKTSKALGRLQQMVKERKADKTYHAIVEKCPKKKEDKMVFFQLKKHQKATLVAQDVSGAQKAEHRYEVIATQGGYTLVQIDLFTGRYHQIRLGLSSIGSPIVGDAKYGASTNKEKIYLHQSQFGIMHPVLKKQMVWQAPFPKEELWDLFR